FDRLNDPVGDLFDLLAALRIVYDDCEFVAAHATDGTVGGDFIDQALGDGAEHGIALWVAERVVDRFESVEIEEHDRTGHIAAGRAAERLAEQLTNSAAVGQAGEDIDVREVG